jgi:hypothetical protein
MTQLSGSLAGIGLSALLRFLSDVRATGHLVVVDGDLQGVLSLDGGRLASAAFERERGLAALEAVALALGGGHFEVRPAAEPLVADLALEPSQVDARLAQLLEEQARLGASIPTVRAVPRLVLEAGADRDQDTLVLDRDALRLLLRVDGTRTVREIAREYGLVHTLRLLARLAELQLVRIEAPTAPQIAAGETPRPRTAAAAPAPRPQPNPSSAAGGPAESAKSGPAAWSRWRRPSPSADAS